MLKVLGEIFEGRSERVAIKYKGKETSYNQVSENVDKYAYHLKGLGINKGDTVALSCQNSPEFVYGYFGVTSVGAVVIPMNLMLTFNEIQYIFNDAKVKTWIVHRRIFEKIGMPKEQVEVALGLDNLLIIDEDFTETLELNEGSLNVSMDEEDLCTILYTSGTTGKPKGVMLSHKNLLSNADSVVKLLGINEKDSFSCVLPFFHTFGFTVTVLTPLFSGAKMIISETFNPKEVVKSLTEDKITIFSGVPSMYVLLLKLIEAKNLQLPHIRYTVSGGAPLPVEVAKTLLSSFPTAEGYGLTEAAPVVSFNNSNNLKKIGSIGRSIPGVEVKVVDDNGMTLPPGIVGELAVKGPNVMKGYLNQPEETSNAIVNGWLLTGDLARVDKDGYIYIVDRKKDMIITSGFNVYPKEIEEVIYKYPDVYECAVIGVEEGTRGEVVKAIVVPKEDKTIVKSEMLNFLKENLAEYKVPKVIEFTYELPKNSTGKILKRKIKSVS